MEKEKLDSIPKYHYDRILGMVTHESGDDPAVYVNLDDVLKALHTDDKMDMNESCIVFFDRLMRGKHDDITENDWFFARDHWNTIRSHLLKETNTKNEHEAL